MDIVMNRTQPTQLFQLPLSESDVSRFKNPDTQKAKGAINCAAVSAQLVGIITREISAAITARNLGIWMDEWVSSMNEVAGAEVYSASTCASITYLFDHLFNGHATMVLIEREGGVLGHYFVIVRSSEGIPCILDPQAAPLGDDSAVYEGEAKIQQYIEKQNLKGTIYVLTTHSPMSVSDHMSLYATSALTAIFERSCSV